MDSIFKRQIRSHNASGQLVEVVIRRLGRQDLGAIRTIASESFDTVWKEKDFDYFVQHPSGFCWGLFIEHKLVGYFLSLLVQSEMDIVSIAVSKAWRRFGLAAMLLQYVWEFPVVSKGFLEVESGNESAILLYEKIGFWKYGLRKKYYGGIKDAVLMKNEKTKSS
jgi:[ribosomal protein S18]-alanine N-acetyltransferase